MATYSKQDILWQLDECAKLFTFPMLDNGYIYLADVRLSAYRDETRWALIIEVLGANPRASGHDSLQNCLHCFGNCLKRPPGTANEDFLFCTSDGVDGPTFDSEYSWYVEQNTHTIHIREDLVQFDISDDNLLSKGITPAEPPRVNGAELLRSLVPEFSVPLLATDEELGARIPPDLPLAFHLDEWHHPDLVRGELPSESRTFQMLADAIVGDNPSHYEPTQPPNTHWRNWPNGGSL